MRWQRLIEMIAVCFVGKQNEPLFFHLEGAALSSPVGGLTELSAENLNIQMILHSSLDIVDERKKRAASAAPSTFDLYLGQLLQVDDYKVFGHFSNTHIKTLVLCENLPESTDAAVREAVHALRGLFVSAIQNPFLATEKPLDSVIFRRKVQQVLMTFNSRAARIV